MKQTLSVLVENRAGVLNRITSLFSRRAFNIDSLAVGVTDDPTLSRITIIVDSGNSVVEGICMALVLISSLLFINNVVEQVEKQLNKLVEVVKVRRLDEQTMIGRELMIVKVSATKNTRDQIMTICNICGAKVADISPTSMTMELSDTPDRVSTFEEMMQPFNILEVARTGIIALQRGGQNLSPLTKDTLTPARRLPPAERHTSDARENQVSNRENCL